MVSAIIVAAGNSTRMNTDISKQFLMINHKEIIHYTVKAFLESEQVSEIIIVARDIDINRIKDIVAPLNPKKDIKYCTGGASRQQSVKNGLSVVSKDSKYIAVHDGARPLITQEDIDKYILLAYKYDAVIPGLKIVDTIKFVENNIIKGTVDREKLYIVQTPQVFKKDIYLKALDSLDDLSEFTDDCGLLENVGQKVYIAEGNADNIKITYKSDLDIAESILSRRRKNMYRIGQGYDVHKLVENRKLILGGVNIPYEKGLLGHSDADVLTHAIMDAILGAAALGDIGKLFPDNDNEYLGADSLMLLKKVVEVISEKGFEILNIDSTVIAQKPKLSPYIEDMRSNYAAIMGISKECVSVKATTEEKLGFTGRGEGISAQAICMLKKYK